MSFFRKFLKRDESADLRDVIVQLGFLADAEESISEFYRLCAGAMPNEADLWNFLAEQELRHAENARRMIERITRDPKQYKLGVSSSTAAIRMFAMEMQRLAEQMNAGQLAHEKLYPVALDIEDSLIEMNYSKIIRTEDGLFNMLARQNDNESAEHKSAILSRMNAGSAR